MLKKVASNTGAQILSKVLTAIISIFLISALTKYLSFEMYGQYNKIYNYLAIFTFLADLGLYTIGVREISKDEKNAQKIVGNIMSIRLILAIGIIFLSLGVAFFLPGYNSFVSLVSIFIIGCFSLVSLLNSSVISLMQAFMRVEFSSFAFVVGKIVNLLLILGVILIIFPKNNTLNFDMAFILIMISGFLGVFINFILNFYYANKIVKVRFLFDWEYMKYLFFTSLPYGIALFLSMVYMKVDVVILSLLEPTQIADRSIALYSVPMKIVEVLMVISGFFLASILPSLSKKFAQKKLSEIQEILKYSFRFLLGMAILSIILGVLLGRDIIGILTTSEYIGEGGYNSYDAFVVVVFILGFYFISSLFNYTLIASKNEKILLKINIFITLFNIIGNILLIPKYSFMGAAYITFVSQIFLFFLGWYFSSKISEFRFEWWYIFGNIVIGGISFLILKLLLESFSFGSLGNILIYGFVGSLIYVICIGMMNINIIREKIKN